MKPYTENGNLKLDTMDNVVKIKVRKEHQENSDLDEMSWQVEERPITPSREWLWALIIIGFAIIVFSVMLKNYLLIIIVILTAFIVYLLKNKNSEFQYFRLDNEGLHIDKKLYPYENFESFWIFPDEEIAFRRKQHLTPLLIVPFYGQEELGIRRILESHLSENEEEESFLDLLRKRFF